MPCEAIGLIRCSMQKNSNAMRATSCCARSAGRARPSSRPRACWSIGAGGLGAPVLLYLAAAGVGTLGVVDDDTVSLSNLQRQVIFGTDDIGKRKVDGAEAVDRAAQSACGGRNAHDADRCEQRAQADLADTTSSPTAPTISPPAISSPTPVILPRSRWSPPRSAPSTARSPRCARTRRAPTAGAIRPIAACFPSRRRPARCRPARKPASSARCRACSAR